MVGKRKRGRKTTTPSSETLAVSSPSPTADAVVSPSANRSRRASSPSPLSPARRTEQNGDSPSAAAAAMSMDAVVKCCHQGKKPGMGDTGIAETAKKLARRVGFCEFTTVYEYGTPPDPIKDAKELPISRSSRGGLQMLPDEAKSATGPAQAISLNLTRVAALCDEDLEADEVSSFTNLGLVKVRGYLVKEENESLLLEIFRSYGDIAKSCTSPLRYKSKLLDRVCDGLKTLKKLKFNCVVAGDVEVLLLDIDNAEKVGFELGWLRDRVVDIRDTRVNLSNYNLVKEAKNKNEKECDELRSQREKTQEQMELLTRMMEEQEKKMEMLQIEAEEIKMKVADTKERVKKFMNMESMVEGLL